MENITNQEGRSWIDYLFTRINDLITIKEYDRALPIAEQGLEMFPNNPDLLYVTSIICQNLNMADKSIQLLEKVLTINPFDQDIRSALGSNLMFQGYYHSALSLMNHFNMMSKDLAGLNKLFIHYCLACSGDEELVIYSCDQCIEELRDEPDTAAYLAVIRALKMIALIQNQEYATAFRLAYEIDGEFDNTVFVAYAKGITAWKNNDFASAETFLRLACTSNPRDMRAKKDLAEFLSILGRHKEAEDIRRDITGFFGSPHSQENPRYRAEELIKSWNFNEAERYLSWACEQYPEKIDLNLPMISLYYLTDRYDLVISSADSLENSPYAWKSVYLKASVYYTAGDTRAAIRCLIAAIVRDRTFSLIAMYSMKSEGFFRDPVILGPEGMAFKVFYTNGFDTAIPLFESLVDTNPDILEYRAFLTYCYILEDRNTDAVICSERLSVSEDPDFCMIRALALRAAGCLEEARQVTEETLKIYPGYVPALNMHVRILIDQDLYRSAYFELLSHQDVLLSDASLMEVFIRCLIHTGDFQNAAASAFSLMMANPDRPLNFSLLAQAFMLDGNDNAALYAIRENFRLDGCNPQTLRLYVKLLLRASVPQEASIFFSDYGEYFPNSPEIRYLKTAAGILSSKDSSDESVEECAVRIFQTGNGVLRGYIGDYRRAARLIREEIKQNPTDYSLRVELAKMLFELRQDSEGLHHLSLAIENGEEDSETLGLMDAALGSLRMNYSIDEFERIARGDEGRLAKLVYQQAVRLNQFGVRRQAIAAFRYLASLLSPLPAVQSIRADACHKLGDLEEAPEWYEQGLVLYNELLSEDPDNSVYLAEMGLLFDNLSRYEEAEDVLVRAMELDPDSGVANSALCWCLAATGRYPEALLYGNKATIHIPDDWGAWNNRGVAKLGLQDFEGAASDFRQAIRCHPGEVIPRRGLCEALLSLDYADAHDAYVDLLVRFGFMAFSHEEGEQSQSAPVFRRNPDTITGYMDGYW